MSGPWCGRTRRASCASRFAVSAGRGGLLRLFLLAATVATATPARDARPQPAADEGGRGDGTDVLVTVGEERIVKADLAAALRRLGAEALPAGEARQRAMALAIEQLVEERLLRMEIARQKIRATDADIDRGVAQLIAQGMPPAEAAGEQVRKRLELDVCTKKLLLPQLDEAALAATLEKHRRELDGTRLRLSHVVLRPDPGLGDEAIPAAVRRAEAIRTQIVDGEMPFAEAAARHSAGPSRHRSGDLGLAVRGSPHHEAFAAAAFALEQGELSRPVVTPFGVHLITVTAVEPGTADPRSLRPKVEQLWARRALADLLARLRQSTSITYAPGVPHVDRDGPGAALQPRDPGASGSN
jgi:parvulin-like peptidyl-prolyl isomerase